MNISKNAVYGFKLNSSKSILKISKNLKIDTTAKMFIIKHDEDEIKFQALQVVKTYESLLNTLAIKDNTASEEETLIKNSYTPNNRMRVFYNNKIIIEDDINPSYKLGNTRDFEAEKYLNFFDLNYIKTQDFSVSFSNLTVSNVKQSTHIYVRVKFDSKFNSHLKQSTLTYESREREALIRIEPIGKKKWNAFIEGIYFFNSTLPIEGIDNDVKIISDSLINNVYKEENAMNNNLSPLSILNSSLKNKLQNFADFKIKLPNLRYSDIKITNPVFYLKMKFDAGFGSKFSLEENIYQPIEGEVVICMEQNGRKMWNGYIKYVKFYKTKPTLNEFNMSTVTTNTLNNRIKENTKSIDDLFKILTIPL